MCCSDSMQPSSSGFARPIPQYARRVVVAVCAMLALSVGSDGWTASKLRAFGVESEPSGAEVYTITGRVGTTPAFISERDIYPNTYPEEKIDQYGMVIIRREGCEEYRKRVSLEDIKRGVKAQLVCATQSRAPSPRSAPAAKPVASADAAAPPNTAQSNSPEPGRQLRWLRTIEELREHNLLSDKEERDIRRRILDGVSPAQ